ncbi:MAG: hypothetical protein FD170_2618, partial [Bacteroidetes bacterium]
VYTDIYSNQASVSLVSAGNISKTSLNVYPVPAIDRINVQSGDLIEGNIRLTLTELTGRTVHSSDYNNIQAGQIISIETAGLSEGIYLLNLTSKGQQINKKVVIRH